MEKFSLTRLDWSLHRQGAKDEARHNEKVKEAIKSNLPGILSDGNIIGIDPKTKVPIKIPLRTLELPRFRFKQAGDNIGTGQGGTEPGDILSNQPGKGKGAGDQEGTEYYEVELTIEELQQLVFSDLGLPNLKPKQSAEIESETSVFNSIRKKRSYANLDIEKTIYQNMLRNAMETGKAKIEKISIDDHKVKTWEQEMRQENSAVVISMADVSGSMGEFEKYITRSFNWWAVSFLRSKFPRVERIFIVHEIKAREVAEQYFFRTGESGGTRCSSANELALKIISERFPIEKYNVYPMHFSDGDNESGDNRACIRLVKQMLDIGVNQYAYVEIGRINDSGLYKAYSGAIDDPRMQVVNIQNKEMIGPAIRQVFNPNE